MNNYHLYTDGAYSPLRKQIGVGLIFINKDTNKKVIEYSNMYKGGSNNVAELVAVIIGLRMIQQPLKSLVIYTDSQYVIGCATLGWQRKKNKIIWQEFDKQMNRVKDLCSNIEFHHVKGHQSSLDESAVYNNQVDELARKSSLMI